MDEITEVRRSSYDTALDCLQQMGAPLGGLDLVVTNRGPHAETVLVLVALLLGAAEEDGGARFAHVRLILPEGISWNVEGSLRHLLRGCDPDAAWARTEVVTTTDRGADALAAAVATAPERTAVVCGFLDLFGSKQAEKCTPDATSESLMGEQVRTFRSERWAAQELVNLGVMLRGLQQMATRYVLCVSGTGPLGDTADAFRNVYDCVATPAASEKTPASLQRLGEWAAALREGVSVDEVRARIAKVAADDDEVYQVLAIALSGADRPVQAFDTLFRYLQPPTKGADAGFIAMGARFALEAGRREEAAALVKRVLDDPRAAPLALRTAAQTARHLSDGDLRLRAATLLHQRIPDDPVGLVLLADQWFHAGRVEDVVSLLNPHVDRLDDEGKYLLTLASYRLGSGGGIAVLQAAVPPTMRQRAVADAIWFATERRDWTQIDEALTAIGADDVYVPEIVRALCSALQVWSLSDQSAHKEEDRLSRPRAWLHIAVSLLASQPDDVRGRLRLGEVIGPEGLGEVSALVMLLPLLKAPECPGEGVVHPGLEHGTAEEMGEFQAYFKGLDQYRNSIILVPKLLKQDVPSALAERLLRGGVSHVNAFSAQQMDDKDVAMIVALLESLLDLVHTTYDTRTPRGAALAIALVHLTVAGLAMQGRHQTARDIVETVVFIGGGTRDPGVHADAWLALADVHMRGHEPRQAILAMALASRVLQANPIREARYRASATRLLRDMGFGFIDEAREQFDALNRIAAAHAGVVDQHQVRGLKWSLALMSVSQQFRETPLDVTEIAQLNEVVREAFEALANDVAPREHAVAGAHLIQAARILRDHGQALPVDDATLHARVASVAKNAFGALEGVLAEVPTLDHIREALATSLASRYGENLVQDARMARVVARRILGSETSDVSDRAAALEIVSDLEAGFEPAVATDARVVRAVMARAFERAREGKDITGLAGIFTPAVADAGHLNRLRDVLANPGNFLARLKACGRDGVLLEATSIIGERLAHLRVSDGDATWTVEPQSVFDVRRVTPYQRTYPYDYYKMDDASFNPEHEVAETVRGLGVSEVPANLAVRCVAPDHRLLAIPANLQLLGDAFAGDVAPTCQVPSLEWLLNVREAATDPVPWRATASVLGEDENACLAPLTIGAEELTGRLTPLGVEVRRNVALRQVVASPVMWLVAHGGLGLDARHFARVSDDRDARHTAGELVAACSGAALVVLLVCSGGRASHELFAERILGLPAELLRYGVRTVVASPWPLNVLVGAIWSEAFASHLRAGDTVARATYAANRTLDGRHPKDRLAMHVYGDPWLRVVI